MQSSDYCIQCVPGSFFLPRDQQNKEINNKHTDYEGLAYLGELPLAWAACCGNQTVYNLLIDAGANPDVQDSFGNMILHMVVVCDKLVRTISMYTFLIFLGSFTNSENQWFYNRSQLNLSSQVLRTGNEHFSNTY